MKIYYNDYRINNLSYKVNPQTDKKNLNKNSHFTELGQISANEMHISISQTDHRIIFNCQVVVNTTLDDDEKSNYRSMQFDLVISFMFENDESENDNTIFSNSHELVMAVISSKIKEIVHQISLLDYLPPLSIRSFPFPDGFDFALDSQNKKINESSKK